MLQITNEFEQHELEIYRSLGISRKVLDFAEPVLAGLRDRFDAIDKMAELNQLRIIAAMQEAHIGEASLKGTTGYGYDDIGRDGLEKVYSLYFHTEDALVRPQITCGTHALALALMSNLRPGQTLLSAAGKPYDTLEEVIGIRKSRGSLAEYGISYRQVDLLPDGSFDFEGLRKVLEEDTDRSIHLVTIQRSKGYQTRRTLSVDAIGEAISFMKSIRPDLICMVDNCYGEFTEEKEPSDVGADMCVGSLIKNPGGGLAPIGGYIAGKKECVENAAVRLTSPGLGKEVGASLDLLPQFFQGFFMGPIVTASALKGAILAANLMKSLAFPFCRTEARTGMTSFRQLPSESRKASLPFARAFSPHLPWTALSPVSLLLCRGTTRMSSWLPVPLCPVPPLNCPRTAPFASRIPSFSRADLPGRMQSLAS